MTFFLFRSLFSTIFITLFLFKRYSTTTAMLAMLASLWTRFSVKWIC